MRYHIITFGCQMNESDSERIAAVLESRGSQSTSNINEADLIVVNMCSVRQSAVDRVYGLLLKFEKLKSINPDFKTILTGCILKEDKKKFAKRFDLILNIKDLPKLPDLLDKRQNYESGAYNMNYLEIQPKYSNNFSAFVPIMTGCNNFCSFCVVPYLREKEISRSVEEILAEIENLAKQGFKEIWLLGQNVNSYSSVPFPQLLRKINDIPGNFWIRFTSSHPKDFSDELIKAMADCEKVAEYLNLPVQSGDNQILKKMNRPYTIKRYKNLIKKIRQKIPKIALSTDIIVGFPGETEKQFQNTLKLFKEIKFDMAYIARYSPRSETAAAKLNDNVSPQEKEKRAKILNEALKQTALENNKKYIGKIVEVLVEKRKNNFLLGKSRTYKTVKLQAPDYKLQDLIGQFVKVKIIDALPWGLKGEISQ